MILLSRVLNNFGKVQADYQETGRVRELLLVAAPHARRGGARGRADDGHDAADARARHRARRASTSPTATRPCCTTARSRSRSARSRRSIGSSGAGKTTVLDLIVGPGSRAAGKRAARRRGPPGDRHARVAAHDRIRAAGEPAAARHRRAQRDARRRRARTRRRRVRAARGRRVAVRRGAARGRPHRGRRARRTLLRRTAPARS